MRGVGLADPALRMARCMYCTTLRCRAPDFGCGGCGPACKRSHHRQDMANATCFNDDAIQQLLYSF